MAVRQRDPHQLQSGDLPQLQVVQTPCNPQAKNCRQADAQLPPLLASLRGLQGETQVSLSGQEVLSGVAVHQIQAPEPEYGPNPDAEWWALSCLVHQFYDGQLQSIVRQQRPFVDRSPGLSSLGGKDHLMHQASLL